MYRPLAATLALLALAPAALAQTATTTDTATDATDQAGATDTAPPEPAYNGTASGTASGVAFSIPVVCEGFAAGGPVTIKSDPNGTPGQDGNEDGQMIDISATPDGLITLQLLTNNNLFSMSDTTAELGPNSLSYSIEMTFSGGATEKVSIDASCN